MKERLVTSALAIAALLLVYVLFIPKPAPLKEVGLPLSTGTGSSGYQVAWRWLRSQHVEVLAWLESLEALNADTSQPRSGNILLCTLPARAPITAREASALDRWVERGNTVLIMAALDDTPAWAVGDGGRLIRDTGRLSRLRVETVDDEEHLQQDDLKRAVTEIMADRRSVLEPRGAHPLFDGVAEVGITSDLPADRFKATPMDQSAVLDLAQVKGRDQPAVWLRRQGKGQVITFAFAGVFSNRDIATGDNGRLLANLVAWSLSPGSRFIFDDARQGATRYYDAHAFYGDSRLHYSLLWLVLLWFTFVLGVRPQRVHEATWRPVDVTGFLTVSGDYLAGAVTPAAAALRLLQTFFISVQRRSGAPEDGPPPWAWLARYPGIDRSELAQLRHMHELAVQGRRIDLVRLQTLLSRLQGKFA